MVIDADLHVLIANALLQQKSRRISWLMGSCRAWLRSRWHISRIQSLLKLSLDALLIFAPLVISIAIRSLDARIWLDQARDTLCHEKELYVLMFNVLDKYDYISFIIDYALKLILNTTPNGKITHGNVSNNPLFHIRHFLQELRIDHFPWKTNLFTSLLSIWRNYFTQSDKNSQNYLFKK